MINYKPLVFICTLFLLFSCEKSVTKVQKRFTVHQGATIGLDFKNALKETLDFNIVNYEYLYNGGGVAVGDINNDGLVDLYFTGTMVPDRLFMNLGDMKFKDITAAAKIKSEGFKTGVSMIDINNDGHLDIYVCRTGKGTAEERANLLFVNDGTGKFSEQAAQYGINSASRTNHATFFDYDLDGDLDLYVLNHPIDFKNSQQIRVKPNADFGYERIYTPKTPFDSDQLFRNEGNGRFTDVSTEAGIINYGYGLSVAIGDLNEDGLPDIYVANDYIETDIFYENNGDGTFSNQIGKYFRHISENSMGSSITDINDDGKLDLMVVDMIAEDNKRQKSLVSSMSYERYHSLKNVGYEAQHMRNVLQINNGNNSFSEIGFLAGVSNTEWSWSPLFADYDNDGKKDLFISNGYRRDLTDCDYTLYKSDSLSKTKVSDINDYLNMIPETPTQNYIFKNSGGLKFENKIKAWGIEGKSFSNGAAYADLDQDGDLDLVVNNIDENPFVYQNNSSQLDSSQFLRIKLIGPATNTLAIGTQLILEAGGKTQYRNLYTTRGFFSSVESIVHFGLGEETLVNTVRIVWPDGKEQTLQNVKTNQLLTITYDPAKVATIKKEEEKALPPLLQSVKPSEAMAFQHKEDEYDDLRREPLIPHKISTQGPSLAVGDVNGDGLEDYFVGGAAGQTGALFLQKTNGQFRKKEITSLQADKDREDTGTVLFDADQDGDVDLYVVSAGNTHQPGTPIYQDRLYLNDGRGNFTKSKDALPELTANGSCVLPLDYDQDGDLDLLVGGRVVAGAYPSSPRTYLLQNNGGKFKDVTATVAPELAHVGMVTAALWNDFNGDGDNELILVGEWMPITLFSCDKQTFKKRLVNGLENSAGWWNNIIAGDFDGDGDLDMIGANHGLNSNYTASIDKPLAIFASDFDQNGSLDPIMAKYYGDKAYPMPQRKDLLKQLPVMQRKLGTYSKYSEATIEDLFTDMGLEKAMHREAKVLHSSFIRNNGDGSFSVEALPIQAQFSTVFGLAANDFDGDGTLDVLLAGNLSGAQVESGPYDASIGLLLKGQGDGSFLPISAKESGINLPTEVRAIEAVQLKNGEKMYVIASSNEALKYYKFIPSNKVKVIQ